MTVTAVEKDAAALTMRITAEYDAPVESVWQLWANPRLLERWWGPPTYPASFHEHDLTPGGRVAYSMNGPDGDSPRGWWKVISAEAPQHLEFEDGFSDASDEPDPNMPVMRMRVDIAPVDGLTRMSITTTFPSADAMERLISMGMEEGMQEALSQIDSLLRDVAASRA